MLDRMSIGKTNSVTKVHIILYHYLFSSAIACRTSLESINSIWVDRGKIPFNAKEHQKKYPKNIAIVTQGNTRSTASTTAQGCKVLKRTGLGATNGPLLL